MQFSQIAGRLPNISKARDESVIVLTRLAKSLPSLASGISIVANGSLARREITSQSEFDAYPLYRNGRKRDAEAIFESIKNISGLREFAEEGAFGVPVPASTIRKRIGGQGDDNRRFTRRMLMLLESVPVGPRDLYDETVRRIVERYINDDITEKQIGRFLLNDIIRFYRTMCVDFEFKTVEQPKPKPWGIRYVKLIYSRKLIYYSGIVMCGALAGLPAERKRTELVRLVALPPIDRLLDTMGEGAMGALAGYDKFLGLLDDKVKRATLNKVQMLRGTHTDEFKAIKASGHEFSRELVDAFRTQYPVTHPIREAVLV